MKKNPKVFNLHKLVNKSGTGQSRGCKIRVCLEGDSKVRQNMRVWHLRGIHLDD